MNSHQSQPLYRQYINELRREGKSITQEYIKLIKSYRFDEKIPLLWKTIASKRYLLPHLLENEYANQEVSNLMTLDFAVSYNTGIVEQRDGVLESGYMNLIRSIEFGCPIYFLERELCEALMRTDAPIDIKIDDIHWIFPQLRIYLPKGLMCITRDGIASPATHIDICKVDRQSTYSLPANLQREIEQQFHVHSPEIIAQDDSLIIGTRLDMDSEQSGIAYALTCPWDGATLAKILETGNTSTLSGSLTNDEIDHEFTTRVVCLAVNILLFLSAIPVEILVNMTKTENPIRKPKQEGKRLISGLYPAKVIGMGTTIRPIKPHLPAAPPTGKHLAPHWRKGHWKRQPYGPKFGLRKFQWIMPYKTHEHEN